MLARITYGLVVVALVTLVAGFFQRSSNMLLYVSIVLSIAAIVLVLIGAARRAREVPAEGAIPEPVPDEYPDLQEARVAVEYDEDEDEEPFLIEDEEEEEEIEVVPRRRPAAATTTRRAPARTAATRTAATRTRAPAARAPAAARSAARSTTRATAGGKVVVVPGRDRYHTGSCRFIQGKDDTEEISAAQAKRRGYQPCSVCKPA